MQRIRIQRQGGKVVFNPSTQMVDLVTDGGSFIFENEDSEAHEPQPTNSAGIWMNAPIGPSKPSPLITANAPGSYPYACKLHPLETGSVSAPNLITIQTQLIQTGFNPQTQALAPPGDGGLFAFLNLDQSVSHRPTPDNPATGVWFTQDIAPGQYSPTRSIVQPGSYAYHCAIHPNEKGTITVPPPKT